MFSDIHAHHHFRARPFFWMGRHRGGRGFGHAAAGFFGGFGPGGPAFRLGRKLAAPDLQLLLLALLDEKPSHGYELIKALEERSGGFYSPSPGMIYPALTYLEEIGHATVEAEGTKKRYHITEAGRTYLQQHRATADAMLAELVRIGEKMARLRHAFTGEGWTDAPWADSPESEGNARSRGAGVLHAARHALRQALHDKRGCSPEEAARIAEILHRAAADIRGDGK